MTMTMKTAAAEHCIWRTAPALQPKKTEKPQLADSSEQMSVIRETFIHLTPAFKSPGLLPRPGLSIPQQVLLRDA